MRTSRFYANKKRYEQKLIPFYTVQLPESVGVNAYLSSSVGDVLELYLTVDQSKQSVIGATANIVAGMDVGSSLTDDDIAGKYALTVSGLYAQALGFAVTAVLGRTDTFFVSKEL